MSNITSRTGTQKKTSTWQNIKNTARGAKIKFFQAVAIAESVAWVILVTVGASVIYSTFKGTLPLNDFELYAIVFATVGVSLRMAWEFIQHLNKEGSKYEN